MLVAPSQWTSVIAGAVSSNSSSDDKKKANIQKGGMLDVLALGLTVVIGGQFFGWNIGKQITS